MEEEQGSVRGLVIEGGKASQGRFCSGSTYGLPKMTKVSLY